MNKGTVLAGAHLASFGGSANSSSPTTATPPHLHDASQQAGILRHVLQDDKQRIGWLLGAGCPLGVYDKDGAKSVTLIPAVVELTNRIANGLKQEDERGNLTSTYRAHWDSLCADCKLSTGPSPTVEDVLTELRTLAHRRGSAPVGGIAKDKLRELDDKICALVIEEVKKRLPMYRSAYTRFASWIAGLQRAFPIEVFTPNYDLLLEQAFERHPLPHFDGFVGSREPWFDLASIEHDVVPSRWTRLWKLHGSINWERLEETVNEQSVSRVVRVTGDATQGKVMIFPSHLKYDQSRRMPYLAMQDRFRSFFRSGGLSLRKGEEGNDAPRLIVCGYSFLDVHLNEVLLDGLRGNRSAQCFALMYGKLSDHLRAVQYAEKQGNLTVLAYDGAVVGTRVGLYRQGTSGGDEHGTWLEESDYKDAISGAVTKRTWCRLGDFHFLGLFLENLYGSGSIDVRRST